MKMYDPETRRSIWKFASTAYDNLIRSIDNVYDDIINSNGKIDQIKHPEEYHLYNNPFDVIDGPCYAFLVHGRGPAVGEIRIH